MRKEQLQVLVYKARIDLVVILMYVTTAQIRLPSQLDPTLYTVLVMSKDKIKF